MARFQRILGFKSLCSVFFKFLTMKSETFGFKDLISKRVFFVVFVSSETELAHRQSFSSWSSAPSFSVENIGFRRVNTAKKTVYPTKKKKDTHKRLKGEKPRQKGKKQQKKDKWQQIPFFCSFCPCWINVSC